MAARPESYAVPGKGRCLCRGRGYLKAALLNEAGLVLRRDKLPCRVRAYDFAGGFVPDGHKRHPPPKPRPR